MYKRYEHRNFYIETFVPRKTRAIFHEFSTAANHSICQGLDIIMTAATRTGAATDKEEDHHDKDHQTNIDCFGSIIQ